MVAGCTWPSQQDFAKHDMDFTLALVTPGQQMRWLRALHREASHIVERCGATQWSLQPLRVAKRLLPYLG